MADAEEPQFTTLAQRIAALKQSQASDAGTPIPPTKPPTNNLRLGKPPPPPASKPAIDRPLNNLRTASVPNGSALNTVVANLPAAKDVLPPPILDREMKDRNLKLSDKIPKKPPPLPGRKASSPNLAIKARPQPPLPQRKPSDQLAVIQAVRKNSNESLRSTYSANSTYSYGGTKSSASSIDARTRKLPPKLEDTVLPPLPPSKKQQAENESNARQARASVISSKSSPIVPRITPHVEADTPPVPQLPTRTTAPTLPSRSAAPPLPSRNSNTPTLPTRPKVNSAIQGFSSGRIELPPPPKPARPTTNGANGNGPPLIPLSSRPTDSQLSALQSKTNLQVLEPTPESEPNKSCLICRDFTAPDHTATLYPRQSLPHSDPLGYLARNLCSPFQSPTDKARAIFTWCHHNILYDIARFFANDISCDSQDPSTIIRSGLAVCSGYAAVFSAIALKAGLDCVVVNGHGKGVGFNFVPGKNQSLPPYDMNHAWNTVRIDGGRWKLIDACWGAGHLGEDQQVHADFNPLQFTKSNVDFGLKHYPEDPGMQFREDGRTLGWEEYMLGTPPYGEPVRTWGGHEKQSVDINSLSPALKHIFISDPSIKTVRFQIFKLCPHWDFEKNGMGKPYCLGLKVPKQPSHGYCEDIVPLHFNGDVWWVDVPVGELGTRGGTVKLQMIDLVQGKDARGLTRDEFLRLRSKRGNGGLGVVSFGGLAEWEIV